MTDAARIVLVTGASGFLARPVIERLVADGWQVRASTRLPGEQMPDWLRTQATAGMLSLTSETSAEQLERSLEGVDAICHLAGRAHVMRETASDPAAAFHAANTVFTRRLAEAAENAGVRRFVFVSTIGVHGAGCRPGERWTEASALRPATPYAESKRAAEDALRNRAGIEHVILRPPLIHGAGAKGNFQRLIGLVQRGLPLPLASVRNRRSFIGARHLAALVAASLDRAEAANRAFVVADREVIGTPELIRLLAAASGKKARLLPFPVALLRGLGAMTGAGRQLEQLIGDLEVDAAAIGCALGVSQPEAAQDSIAAMARGLATDQAAAAAVPV